MMGTMNSKGTRSGKSLIDQKSMKRDPSKDLKSRNSFMDSKSLGDRSMRKKVTEKLSKSPSNKSLNKKASRKKLEEQQDIKNEEFDIPQQRTIKTIEFMKDKFMSNNMGQDLPVEGGVKLTQPGGAGVSVGGDYKPVRKQMSIQDFNT